MRKLIVLVIVASMIALSGCNTMRGFGKDMEQAGEKIQKKSSQ